MTSVIWMTADVAEHTNQPETAYRMLAYTGVLAAFESQWVKSISLTNGERTATAEIKGIFDYASVTAARSALEQAIKVGTVPHLRFEIADDAWNSGCDDCAASITVEGDTADRELAEAGWYSGKEGVYCPACAAKYHLEVKQDGQRQGGRL